MRVAVLSRLESVPWVPIVGGLLEGFRGLAGVDARGFALNKRHWLHVSELEAFEPDLVLFPCYRGDWADVGPYLQAVRRMRPPPRTAAVAFDDPYDMETGLAMGAELHYVFTPERLAVDVYKRERIDASHLLPTISTALHYPDHTPLARHLAAEYSLDVFQVGGTNWIPRNKWLPGIRAWCKKRGRRYGEVAGKSRWIVGEDLTRAIHASRTVLEIPRFDLPTQSNPHQVVCTYTGPRVYLVAACGGLPIVIGPREDLGHVFPDAPHAATPEEGLELLEYWTAPDMDTRRRKVGGDLLAHFLRHHRPVKRACQILEALGFGSTPVFRARRRPPGDPPARSGSTSPPGAAIAAEQGTPPPG